MHTIGVPIPIWGDGEAVDFDRYVKILSKGGVAQTDSLTFEFRPNLRTDIMNWLQSYCKHHHVCCINEGEYRGKVTFASPDGAMEFKLRWC